MFLRYDFDKFKYIKYGRHMNKQYDYIIDKASWRGRRLAHVLREIHLSITEPYSTLIQDINNSHPSNYLKGVKSL